MLVRHLDWEESLAAEQSQHSKHTTGPHQENGGHQPGSLTQARPDASSAPHVASEYKFEVIIGTDILYEVTPWSKHEFCDMQGLKSTHLDHFIAIVIRSHICCVAVSFRLADAVQEAHSKLVAAVLNHRLTMHGQALICCAVRDQV